MDTDAAGTRFWPPGTVAKVLGVSPVTLRSWSARYGIGPARGDGGQRRYTDLDLRRLQQMRRLVDRGVRPREAADAVFSSVRPAPAIQAGDRLRELAEAVDDLRFDAVADLLDETLAALGVTTTWMEVLGPLLHDLGNRWLGGDPCFASEWALTSAVSGAFERFGRRLDSTGSGTPAVLACCPHERHALPMEALRAALLEVRVPAVFLGPAASAETVADMAARLRPAVVVLWSRSPSTSDALLAARLREDDRGVVMAGPGWVSFAARGFPWVDDFTAALEWVTDHVG